MIYKVMCKLNHCNDVSHCRVCDEHQLEFAAHGYGCFVCLILVYQDWLLAWEYSTVRMWSSSAIIIWKWNRYITFILTNRELRWNRRFWEIASQLHTDHHVHVTQSVRLSSLGNWIGVRCNSPKSLIKFFFFLIVTFFI